MGSALLLLTSTWLMADDAVLERPADAEPVTLRDRAVVLDEGTQAKILERVPPKYPRSALNRGIETWVTYRFDVGVDGRPQNLNLVTTPGKNAARRDIEAAAKQALRQWQFEPATVDGVPSISRNHLARMIFHIRGQHRDVSGAFASNYRKVTEANEKGDTKKAWAIIEKLKRKQHRPLGEQSLLAAAEANTWEASGDLHRAADAADKALYLMDSMNQSAYLWAASSAIRLNILAADYLTALSVYEQLSEREVPVAPEDPLHEYVSRVRRKIDSNEPLITEATITACEDWCTESTNTFSQGLSRRSFTIDSVEGEIDSLTLRCAPAYVELAWEPGIRWVIENEHESCSLTVEGALDTTFQLVELPEEPAGHDQG